MKTFILINIFSLWAFSSEFAILHLKELNLTENISEELRLIVNHLNTNEVTYEQAKDVLAACTLINNDVTNIDSVNFLFLIKSEIYKGLLDNQHLSYSDSIQISESILASIENKFKENQITYSQLATWIYDSIMQDIKPYRTDGFINRYQTVSRTNMKEMAKSLELQKALKYISPWVIAIESMTPEKFNELLSLISVDILKQISRKTYFFKEFSKMYSSKQRDSIFSIPSLAVSEEVNTEAPDNSLQNKQTEMKESAKDVIEALENTQDLEGSKKALDDLIEEKTKKDEGWTPKE